MDVSVTNGVSNTYKNTTTDTKTAENATITENTSASTTAKEDEAVVFEKSNETKKASTNQIYNREAVVAKLKADQQSRFDALQSLVEKLLNKQGSTFDLANGTNLADKFRMAAQNADPETIKAAQESIAEDGYWGVNQTSDRLVSMAIALSGGDTDKADELMNAIEKGYKQATQAWGEDLPQICQDTMDATRQKMNDWKNGVTTASDYSNYLS
ncbi:MAG: hypothetical protein Q4D32_01155 [Eubacteriales bacterium]|nr:hypothetical protein [Eubacteriales bacterium]